MATNFFTNGTEKMFCVVGYYTLEYVDFINRRRAASSYPSEPAVPGTPIFMAGPYSKPAPAKQHRNEQVRRNVPYTNARDSSYDRPKQFEEIKIVEGFVATWTDTGL